MNKELYSFSPKQMTVLNWWCEESEYKDKIGIICDGAVRSGKTLCMTLSFVLWAFYRFADSDFALCGKTVTSLRRNVITPILPLLRNMGFSVTEKLSANIIYITFRGRTNRFYLFGGRDESSQALIQGITLSGVIPIQKTIVAVGIKKCTVSAPPDEKEDNSVKIQENLRTILITVGINLYVPYKSGTRGSVQAFDKIFNRLLDANRQGLCESKLLGTKYSRETQSLVTETEFVFKSGIGQSDLEYFEPIVTG